jgi:hypothetical protein
VSTSNWSTYQSVKSTNSQLMECLIWLLFKTTRTNLINFPNHMDEKIKFSNLGTNEVFNKKNKYIYIYMIIHSLRKIRKLL